MELLSHFQFCTTHYKLYLLNAFAGTFLHIYPLLYSLDTFPEIQSKGQ